MQVLRLWYGRFNAIETSLGEYGVINVAASFFMGLPIAFLLYTLVIYLRWKRTAEPGASFAKDYWYTEKNPLHRTWWPLVAALAYMILIVIAGMTGLAE